MTQRATPSILALPIYQPGSDTQINPNIHIYP
ncbi:hypothetical protein [Leuconostoc lactis]